MLCRGTCGDKDLIKVAKLVSPVSRAQLVTPQFLSIRGLPKWIWPHLFMTRYILWKKNILYSLSMHQNILSLKSSFQISWIAPKLAWSWQEVQSRKPDLSEKRYLFPILHMWVPFFEQLNEKRRPDPVRTVFAPFLSRRKRKKKDWAFWLVLFYRWWPFWNGPMGTIEQTCRKTSCLLKVYLFSRTKNKENHEIIQILCATQHFLFETFS